MLYEELKKIATPLANFIEKYVPRMKKDEIRLESSRKLQRGKCYLFGYPTPKTQAELSYFHAYPCIMYLGRNRKDKESFIGLNLLYLSPSKRKTLLRFLMSYFSGRQDSYNSRCNVDYALVTSLSGESLPCVKSYKYTLVNNGIALQLKPESWNDFFLGPAAVGLSGFFKGKPAPVVWDHSNMYIRKYGNKTKFNRKKAK